LLRLYFRILLSAGAAVFVLHGVVGFMTGFGDAYGPVLIGMDAVLLLLGVLGSELTAHAQAMNKRPRAGFLLTFVGLYLVLLASETGGLASPVFMLLLVTCLFGALIMSGLGATLLTALIGAMHATSAWLLPHGILHGGVEGVRAAILGGRQMALSEVTGIAMHSAFLFLGAWIANRLSSEFRSKVHTLEDHATRDPLTQLPQPARLHAEDASGNRAGRTLRLADFDPHDRPRSFQVWSMTSTVTPSAMPSSRRLRRSCATR